MISLMKIFTDIISENIKIYKNVLKMSKIHTKDRYLKLEISHEIFKTEFRVRSEFFD